MTEDKDRQAGKAGVDDVAAELLFVVDELLEGAYVSALAVAVSVPAVIRSENRLARRKKFAHDVAVAVDVFGVAVNRVQDGPGRRFRRPPFPENGFPVRRFKRSG
jgi:hypothetical protein